MINSDVSFRRNLPRVNPYITHTYRQHMVESEYEKLLKRISDKISDGSTKNSTRFEIPPVDVVWEGQKTFLRNFSEYPKILRRDPDKILQLAKEFAVPAQLLGEKAMFIGKRDPDDFTRLFGISKRVEFLVLPSDILSLILFNNFSYSDSTICCLYVCVIYGLTRGKFLRNDTSEFIIVSCTI